MQASPPLTVRLIFVAIGILLLALCWKLGGAYLRSTPTAQEMFIFLVLVVSAIMCLSFLLPKQYGVLVLQPLLLMTTVLLAPSVYLWHFDGYWRWGIVVLGGCTLILIIKTVRKQHEPRNADNWQQHDNSANHGECTAENGAACDGATSGE